MCCANGKTGGKDKCRMKLTEKMRYSSKLWEIEKTDGTGFLAMAIA
jgi:hypothetical protein